ncbi:Arylsulfotransferase [Candidatus Magnetomorum sp. HK-1]|nr:Arylsulfotransferase [Candidatus Magnetomorum sp. HK-1]
MPLYSTEAYLINNYGNTIHSWDTGYNPSNSCYLLSSGNFLQTADMGDSIFDAAATGGRVMEVATDSSTEWTFDYYGDEYILHHDVEYMSNGNVLMIAYELISYDDALAAGRKPRYLSDEGLYSDMILEVNPSSGEIVWQWRVWDHLIQDQNSNKDAYGIVADHPEKIDLNYTTKYPDYNHFNSVDYNEELDQILISCKIYNEIWMIDHSTSTEEAASDSGGTYGKG